MVPTVAPTWPPDFIYYEWLRIQRENLGDRREHCSLTAELAHDSAHPAWQLDCPATERPAHYAPQPDFDLDGRPDHLDGDDDNDGEPDTLDPAPYNAGITSWTAAGDPPHPLLGALEPGAFVDVSA
jgi:hypothetical protein